MFNFFNRDQTFKSNDFIRFKNINNLSFEKRSNSSLLRIYPGSSGSTMVGKVDDICDYLDWRIAFESANV